MNLAKYQELTGITVPSSKTTYVTAQLNRVQSMLETMLGYTLSPDDSSENLYNELGKTTTECACPDVDTEDLNDPDDVVGAYRLYTYNQLDQYFHVDPFKSVNKVKLVFIKQNDTDGECTNGVTVKTFSDSEIKISLGRDGIGKYIQHCQECLCLCECSYSCVQLAVDAEWLWDDQNDIPLELQYVMADMVTYYSNPKYKIKSESITSHSYTKFDNTAPEMEPYNLAVIKRYAGPNGSVVSQPTVGVRGSRNVGTIGL